MTDLLTTMRARRDELGLRSVDLARRCQALHPLEGPRGWERQVVRTLGPEGAPRMDLGATQAWTLLVMLRALDLDLEVRPVENRPPP